MARQSGHGAGGARRHDPYQLLEVGPDATVEQINTAYRKALRRQHPDTRAELDPSAREPSMADLQAARADLLRNARARANHETSSPTDSPPDSPTRPRPRPQARTSQPDRPTRTRRGWAFRLDGIDIVVGPVRYHGPSGPHTS
jgi:curved DNA-binding protein CbpA